MAVAELIFWCGLIIVGYTFVGYPLLMLLLGRRQRIRSDGSTELPDVTLVICAYNEETIIGAKLRNALNLNYPSEKLRIVVVSDGSTDRTNEIVSSFEDSRLQFISYHDRGGKVKALNTAIGHIAADVAVFTDANVIFEPDAVQRLVAALADPGVGCAVGNVILRSPDGSTTGEGIYSRYEKAVHTAEGIWRTMITIDGAMYAVRSEFIEPLPPDTVTDDWYLATGVLRRHSRIVYVPEATGYEDAAASVSGEFVRKVRMVAGGYQTAIRRASVFFNPFDFPAVSFMFGSHKLLRWLTVVWLAALLVGSTFSIESGLVYAAAFWAQILFYGLAVVGYLLRGVTSAFVIYVPYYFVAVNIAALAGLFRYLSGTQRVTWERGRH